MDTIVLEFQATEQMPSYHSLVIDATRDGQQFEIKDRDLAKHLVLDFPKNWKPISKIAKDFLSILKKEAQVGRNIVAVELTRNIPKEERADDDDELPPPELPK